MPRRSRMFPSVAFPAAAYPFHDVVHHIVGGHVGLPRRLRDKSYRDVIERTAQKELQHRHQAADADVFVMEEGSGLIIKGLAAILVGVSLQVFLVEAVFGDVIQSVVGTKYLAMPSYHPDQFCCRCAVGKQYKQSQKWTASRRCFLHLDSCHIAAYTGMKKFVMV